MDNRGAISKTVKIIFIILFLISLTLNFYQSKIIEKNNASHGYLINYKKAYIKLIEVIGVDEEHSQRLLRSVEQDGPKTSP